MGSVSGIVRCSIIDLMAVMFSEASKTHHSGRYLSQPDLTVSEILLVQHLDMH